MKTVEELRKIRENMADAFLMFGKEEAKRVVVGMATCGITAGAKPILTTIENEVKSLGLDHVTVTQVGCIGECALEPIVEVFDGFGNRTTYAKVTIDIAKEIVASHLIDNIVLTKQVIGNFK